MSDDENAPSGERPRAEQRWTASAFVLLSMLIPLLLPPRYAAGTSWLLPAIEGAVLLALVIVDPGRIDRPGRWVRALSIALVVVIAAGAAWAAGRLVWDLLHGNPDTTVANELLLSGALVWLQTVLAFGFLYLKLGLYASIMMHFAIDFMSVPLNVWPDNLAVTLTIGLFVLAWLAIGVPYMLLYFSKGLGWLLGRRVWPDLPPKPPEPVYVGYYPPYAPAPAYPAPQSAPPAPYGGVPPRRADDDHAYLCNNCGNSEAVYTEGKLVCTRCGSKR